MLDEHEVAQVLEQVGDEAAHVVSLVGELLHEGQEAGRVPVDDEVEQAEEGIVVDRAEQLEHRGDGHVACRRRGQLVERRDRVAEAAAGAAGDERQGGIGRLDALAVGDDAKHSRQLTESWTLEAEGLTARADGREHLREIRRAEDEDEVRRRLLDQLQERVEGGVGELMRLVEDVDLVAPLDRLEDHVVADLADVVDPALGRRVHLDDVERRARRDRPAGVALAARRRRGPVHAVERLRDDSRHGRLPGPTRAGEQVRLPHLVSLDRVAQRAHDRLLTHHLVEVLGPVLPVERGHGSMLDAGDRA